MSLVLLLFLLAFLTLKVKGKEPGGYRTGTLGRHNHFLEALRSLGRECNPWIGEQARILL